VPGDRRSFPAIALERVGHEGADRPPVERLADHRPGRHRGCPDPGPAAVVAGDQPDRQRRPVVAHLLGERDAVEARHDDVAEQEVVVAEVERLERPPAILDRRHGVALKLERPANEFADRPIVLGYQNPARGPPPCPAARPRPGGADAPSPAGLGPIRITNG